MSIKGGAIGIKILENMFINGYAYKQSKDEMLPTGGYIMDTILSNEYVLVYNNPYLDHTVIIHRGTSITSIYDIGNNVRYAFAGQLGHETTERFTISLNIQEKAIDKYECEKAKNERNPRLRSLYSRISTAGHSQGGLLAKEVVRRLENPTKKFVKKKGSNQGSYQGGYQDNNQEQIKKPIKEIYTYNEPSRPSFVEAAKRQLGIDAIISRTKLITPLIRIRTKDEPVSHWNRYKTTYLLHAIDRDENGKESIPSAIAQHFLKYLTSNHEFIDKPDALIGRSNLGYLSPKQFLSS